MFSAQVYYLLRSKTDGRYLVAHITDEKNYILVFKESYDALSYLNTHASEFAQQFATESVTIPQLQGIRQRWGYQGLGMVEDPLEPRLQFMLWEQSF